MPRKAAPKQTTSVAISAEARQLLALMAEKSGISPSAMLEMAIRERADREKVIVTDDTAANGARAQSSGTPPQPEQPDADWRAQFESLVEKMRRNVPEQWSPEELERQIALACAEVRESRRADRR
jgi:predicted transcriptional regulator